MGTTLKGRKRMNFLNLKDIRVLYATQEESQKKEIPTLVFIHGAGGDSTVWAYQFEYFKEKTSIYIPELPGHGQSRGSGATSIAEYADTVKDILDALDLTSVTLIGHSMGGAITQHLALHNPDRLESIVLVSTGARLKVSREILNRVKDHFQEVVATICDYGFGPEAPRDLIIRTQEQLRQNSPEVLYRDFAACNQFDLMEKVRYITLPTLILCGKMDGLTPIQYSRYLHEHISGSSLKLIEGAGHMVMLEKPEEFNRELEAFVKRPANPI
jgi:pimeloyl-ACP methyl ester carboxylesterase